MYYIDLIFLGALITGIFLVFLFPEMKKNTSFRNRMKNTLKIEDKVKTDKIKKLALGQVYENEAVGVISELVNSYKLNQHNLDEAINAAIINMKDAPYSQKLFTKLAASLNQSQGDIGIEKAIGDFEKSIGSSWAENLGEIIYCGHVMGLDVEIALLDLLDRVKKNKVLEEYSKRKNNEARLMIKWLTPISYLSMIMISTMFFDITVGHFLENQFATSLGRWWFMIIIFFYGISLLVYFLLTRRRMVI